MDTMMVDDVAATKKKKMYKLLLKTSFVVENVVCTSETVFINDGHYNQNEDFSNAQR